MSKTYNVAVVGATGAVGETMLTILAERKFPIGELIVLASERSAGEKVEFGDAEVVVQDLATFDPTGVDIALFSAGGSVSKEYAPKFAAAGAVVIDNSSAFRYDDDVPLVVSRSESGSGEEPPARHHRQPELLDHADAGRAGADPPRGRHRAHQRRDLPVGLRRRPLGAGGTRPADRARCSTSRTPSPKCFPVQIAFNVIPHIDDFQDNGYTKEEMKLVWETRKILGDDSIQVNADRGARAGVLRPLRGGAHRDPREDHRRRGARSCWRRRRAWKWSTSARPAAIRRR